MPWPWSSPSEDPSAPSRTQAARENPPPSLAPREQSKPPPSSSPPSSPTITSWQTLFPTFFLTSTLLGLAYFYHSYLRRIPVASAISPSFWRRRSLFGRVTSVGDGDNFRLFHTPGGRLAGWGWSWRKVPRGKELKDRTIHVRLAGVDAPEMAHFGRPEQPYGKEALDWLTRYILQRRVRAYVYKRDHYDRAVATVYVRRWFLRRDVGLQMLRAGLATVYDAKTGAEFGQLEETYRRAEMWAKTRSKGMWGAKGVLESPGEYKARMRNDGK